MENMNDLMAALTDLDFVETVGTLTVTLTLALIGGRPDCKPKPIFSAAPGHDADVSPNHADATLSLDNAELDTTANADAQLNADF